MAKTVELKIPADIEFKVIGDALGLLIASAGLLAGTMVRERSFDYWLVDIVPLVIVAWLGFRLYRNLLSTLTAYRDYQPQVRTHSDATVIKQDQTIMRQIPSPDKVVEEVARRIDAKKAAAEKKNNFTK